MTKRSILLSLFALIIAMPAMATVHNVATGYGGDIQLAIDAASPFDTVYMPDGTYTPTSTLNITKALTLQGQSEGGAIIDASGLAGYGMTVSSDDVTLEYFTILPTAVNYPIHASGTSNPPNGFYDLTVRYVTIVGAHQRTAFDIHGYTNVVLSHLTAGDATGGNGVQVTGCINVDADNITTFNNAWGSFAVYVSQLAYLGRGSSDVVIDGDSSSFGEANVYSQDEFAMVNTLISVTGYEYIVLNDTDIDGYHLFKDTYTDAVTVALLLTTPAASYIIVAVDGSFVVADGMTIQAAIDHASPGDDINVGAGTFSPITISAGIELLGAQAGVDARGRVVVGAANPAVETIIAAPSGNLCTLLGGSAGAIIDGFAFVGATKSIQSTSGPIHGIVIRNNHMEGSSGSAVNLNDTGNDVTVHQNSMDGTNVASGGLLHLDTDGFDGFQLTSNWLRNCGNGTGFFVDGNHNVGVSGSRPPLFEDNLLDGNATGANLGSRAVEYATIQNNTFSNNEYDGLQGGIQNSLITQNVFSGNDRSGLALTSFGNTSDPTRGAQGNTISNNVFFGNAGGGTPLADIYFSNQYDGTQATNTVSGNSFGSAIAASNNETSGETIDVSGNWWSSNSGPTVANHPSGTGGGILGASAAAVDFTPWLDSGTDTDGGTPGFQGDFSELWVDDDSPQWGAIGIVQEGIDLAVGSTVNVAAGTYVAPAQIVIDHDLTLIGAGKTLTTIEPGFNTTTGNYLVSSALVYVDYGVTATIEDLAIDGTGYTVKHAIQARGADLTVRSCEIRDIFAGIYAGRGILYLTGTGLVEDCTMSGIQRIGVHIRGAVEPIAPVVTVSGLDYTGKGDGDFLDYGVEFGGGGKGLVTGSTIVACRGVATTDGSTSAGILVTDYYGGGTEADIQFSTLTGNSTGIVVGYDTPDISDVAISNCIIAGNTDYGVTSTGVSVDAFGNWWGDASGPYDGSDDTGTGGLYNPSGTGDAVTDNVLYVPWLDGNVIFTPNPQTISLADLVGANYKDVVVCEYLGGGSGPVYGYSIDVNWNPAILSAGPGSFVKPVNGPFATAPLFIAQDMNNGSTGHMRIDAALGGATPGIVSGEFFKATFTAVGTPDYVTDLLDITVNSARESDNTPVTGLFGGTGLMIVDLQGPSLTAVAIVNTTLSHTNDYVKDTDDVTVTATIADGGGMLSSDIVADLSGFGGGAAVNPDSYVASLATWTLTGVTCSPSDGPITVTVDADDGVGNSSSGSDNITADNTAPAALAGLNAAPGHEKVVLGWNDATSNDLYADGVVIRYIAWGAYPNYNSPLPGAIAAPAYPADETAGDGEAFNSDNLGLLAATHSIVARDIYYYAGFVYDIARNYSNGDTGAEDRATNYWLGDVYPVGTYDGLVAAGDVTQLGSTYGLSDGHPSFKDYCDVGPTDNWSGLGIPLPDDMVGFEDLMIFSLNYGVVAPLPVFQENATEEAQIAWRMVEDNVWSLVLEQPCLDLKGLNLQADLPAGSVLDIRPGWLCDEQAGMIFLQNIDANGLDAGLALMGTDLTFIGAGELLRVTFSESMSAVEISVDLRSSENQPVVSEIETTGAPEEMPSVYRMAQNYPNPFNPKTDIRFDLPDAQSVKLTVYGPDGKRIVTLVDESLPAGFHSVTWNGRDESGSQVASGVYFYRIEAGPLRQTSKMLMLK